MTEIPRSTLVGRLLDNGGKAIVVFYCIAAPAIALLYDLPTANEYLQTGFIALGMWWIVENVEPFVEWVVETVGGDH